MAGYKTQHNPSAQQGANSAAATTPIRTEDRQNFPSSPPVARIGGNPASLSVAPSKDPKRPQGFGHLASDRSFHEKVWIPSDSSDAAYEATSAQQHRAEEQALPFMAQLPSSRTTIDPYDRPTKFNKARFDLSSKTFAFATTSDNSEMDELPHSDLSGAGLLPSVVPESDLCDDRGDLYSIFTSTPVSHDSVRFSRVIELQQAAIAFLLKLVQRQMRRHEVNETERLLQCTMQYMLSEVDKLPDIIPEAQDERTMLLERFPELTRVPEECKVLEDAGRSPGGSADEDIGSGVEESGREPSQEL